MAGVLQGVERAAQLLAAHLTGTFAGVVLDAAEADVLFHLAHLGAGTPVGQLGRAAGRRASTTTAVLDRLEKAGLLERRRNPADRRSYLLVLTPAGEEVAAKIVDRVTVLEQRLEAKLSPADLAGFRRVVAALEEAPT